MPPPLMSAMFDERPSVLRRALSAFSKTRGFRRLSVLRQRVIVAESAVRGEWFDYRVVQRAIRDMEIRSRHEERRVLSPMRHNLRFLLNELRGARILLQLAENE